MKKEQNHVNYRRLEIIRRVATLCTEDQVEKIEDFILLEGGDNDSYYLKQETDELLVTNLIPLY